MRIGAFFLCAVFCFLGCGRSHSGTNSSLHAGFSPADPSAAMDAFPTMPDETMTPGALCQRPDERRYPENIAYCYRNVSSSTKNAVIHAYDQRLGYSIESMDRQEFKIDHFIPLCMGGGNDVTNLWPQHRSVYVLTDSLEDDLCKMMAQGAMNQDKAIETLKYAKRHLDEAESIDAEIKQRLNDGDPSN